MHYKIEKGMLPPRRGPRSQFTDIPFEKMKPGDSVVVSTCTMGERPSRYNGVKKIIEEGTLSGKIKGKFVASTRTLQDGCEVRVFRLK